MFAIRNRSGQANGRRIRWRARLFIQALESRHAPAQFTVNTITDTGAGSGLTGDLRYCIAQANANPGADTISFDLGGPATITLNGTQLPFLGDVTGATTIAGPGAQALTIDAKHQSRVLATNAAIVIDGITITNGYTTESLGGGAIMAHAPTSKVTITNSVLAGNSTTHSGGFINAGGAVMVTNSTLIGNSAGNSGGGINCNGPFTATNSVFIGNSADNVGGGICCGLYATTTVTNSAFIGNMVKLGLFGAGIGNFGTATVANSTFSGNSGSGIHDFGSAAKLTVMNSTFSGNSASRGAGIYHNNVNTIAIISSTLNNNSASSSGGGLYLGAGSSATLINSIVAGNLAHSSKDIFGNFTQLNCLVNMSAAAAGLGTLGNYGGPTQTIPLLPGSPAIDKGTTLAGITTDQRGIARPQGAAFDIGAFEFVFSPSLVVTTTSDEDNGTSDPVFGTGTSLREAINYANAHAGADTITFNVTGTITLGGTQLPALSDKSGATTIAGPGANLITIDAKQKSRVFQINSGVTTSISGVTISGGRAGSLQGGGIFTDGTLTVTDSTISGNSAYSGGGIYNRLGTLTVTNTTVGGNSAFLHGGGVYNNNNELAVTNSHLIGNKANVSGGGIYNAFGILTVTNSTLIDNRAVDSGGGLANFHTVNMTDSTLSGNTALSKGGGISNAGAMTMRNSKLTINSAEGTGGGIYNQVNAALTMWSSTFSGNSSAQAGGGIFNNGTSTVTNSTFSGDSAPVVGGAGGAIFNNVFAVLSVTNSTFTGNLARSGGGIFAYGTVTVTNSIVAGNTANVGHDVKGSAKITSSIIGNTAGTTFAPGSSDNIVDVPALLGPLGNYGGPTQTIPLLPGSPAIDAGNSIITMDQRGLPRFGAPDIGAFESQGFSFTLTGSGQTAFITTMFASPLAVTVTANNPVEPVDGGVVTFTPPTSGASAILSGSHIIIAGGKAAVTATANDKVGKYNVTATSGGHSANFALTNGGPTNLVSLSFVGGNLSASFGNQGNIIEVFGQTGAVKVRSNYTVVGTYAVTGIITVGGGSGADTFTLAVNSGAAFPGLVTVNAVAGDDEVSIGSSAVPSGTIPNLTLNLGEGNNKVIDNGFKVTNSWTLNAGAGNDTIGPLMSPVGTLLSINAGNGDNTASIFSKVASQVRYNGGIGKDNVTVGGLNSFGLYVYLGAGSDTFTFAPGSSIGSGIIDFGADVDLYVPNGVFVGSALTLLNLP